MASLFCRFSPPSARHIEDHGHTLQKFIYYYPLGFCRFLFTLWSYIMGCNSHFLCVSITAHGLDASSSRAGLIEKKNGLFPIPHYQRWIMPQICILCVTCCAFLSRALAIATSPASKSLFSTCLLIWLIIPRHPSLALQCPAAQDLRRLVLFPAKRNTNQFILL